MVWKTLGGDVVQTDTDVPLADAMLLWPGATIDVDGNGTGWPGWTIIDGEWVEIPDERDGTLIVEVSVNPTTTGSVTYPEATAACAAGPDVTPAGGGGSTGGGSTGGGSTGGSTSGGGKPSPTSTPEKASAAGGNDPSVAGTSNGNLPRTGGDLAGALAAGLTLVLLGMVVRLGMRRVRPAA